MMDEQEIVLDSGHAKMCITGKIDRIDIYEDDKNVYVRVVDYKLEIQILIFTQVYYGLKCSYLHI